MGLVCSKPADQVLPPSQNKADALLSDPFMHVLEQRSLEYATGDAPVPTGQSHLLHKHQRSSSRTTSDSRSPNQATFETQKQVYHPTRLVVRRRAVRALEEGLSGTHIYAIRFPADQPLKRELVPQQPTEQAPPRPLTRSEARPRPLQPQANPQMTLQQHYLCPVPIPVKEDLKEVPLPPLDYLFARDTMLAPPKSKVKDWVTVSEEHKIYVADVGLTLAQCDALVQITETVCRGQYAAYTYAKQTLGCREFPALAQACQEAVHTTVHAIIEFSGNAKLMLDDREPHMVKYDDTKRERQKLDMHTDKSEWTFLISLSGGSGFDYDGGGTYFECLDATMHIQRGHALIFPGKLRHCGQRITRGLRFLLVGFLVDKATPSASATSMAANNTSGAKNAPADAASTANPYVMSTH